MSRAQTITRVKGGDWHGSYGLIPTPGHSAKDRGLSVKDNAAGDDIILHAHNAPGFNWRAYKDELRNEGLVPPFAPDRPQAQSASLAYVYRNADGSPAYRVVRKAGKRFMAEHQDEHGNWRTGMNGSSALPYRLPELLAADPDAAVFICEGEKDAENLAKLGCVATTNPFGAGKWLDSFAPYLADREVVILPDNDDAGRDHAADVSRKLAGTARSVAVVALPGLADKGDVSDWIAAGGTLAGLYELIGAPPAASEVAQPATAGFQLIDPSAWHGVTPPARQWALSGWIPAGQATYLTGPGSAGKSLLAQQLCTCMAAGLPFMGVEARQGVAIYLTCEDDAAELHRRQASICESLGVPLNTLSGRLHLVSLMGLIGNELATFDGLGRMATTPAWEALLATVIATGATFIALDNVAHLFSGNENIRNQVAGFCGLLNRLASECGATVLFLGHPNKAGDSFSGSTAWENQVRSRLFLQTPTDDDGNAIDRDARTLTVEKANYARNGEALAFRWHRWAFVREEDLPGDEMAHIAATITAAGEDAAFLRCLSKATEEKRATSPSRSASNYAPKMFATMPTAKGIKQKGFEAALHRLLDSGEIVNAANVYQRDNRSWATGLGLAQTLAQTPAQTLHEACTNPQTGKGE